MLITPHALVGILIASKIDSPFVSLPLALFSHFLLDMIPHWNWRPSPKFFNLLGTTLDAGGALAATYFFSRLSSRPIIIALGALLPATVDIFDVPYYFFGWGGIWERYTQFSRGYQSRAKAVPGLITQLLLVDLCLLLLFWGI